MNLACDSEETPATPSPRSDDTPLSLYVSEVSQLKPQLFSVHNQAEVHDFKASVTSTE